MDSPRRTAVVVKIYGGTSGLLPIDTDWRVAHTTSHIQPGGVIGEVDPEWTIIEFHPADAVEPAEGDIQRRCWTIQGPDPIGQCVLYNGHDGDHNFGGGTDG